MKDITPHIPVVNLKENNIIINNDIFLDINLSYSEMKKLMVHDIWDVICFKISVIIPSHGRHVLRMDELFNNLSEMVLPVHEVIVSFSLQAGQSLEELAKKVTEYRNNYKHKINLKCILNPENMVTSANRNIAASQATGDILLFLDADDLYHPQLTQIVQHVWKKCDPVDLHWFNKKTTLDEVKNVKYNTENVKIVKMKDDYTQYFEKLEFFPWEWEIKNSITHGHHAMRRDVWEDHPYIQMIPMGEDAVHMRELLSIYPERSYFVPLYLSLYRQNESAGYTSV